VQPTKVVLDPVQLGKLAEMCCSIEEVAAYFRTTIQTVRSRLKKEPLKTVWESGLARGRISLRRAQMQSALGGDRTMQIWLGKQLLDQKDKIDQDVKQEQKWVVELPPAMTADQWLSAFGKTGGDVITPGGAKPGSKRLKRKNARILNRDEMDDLEEEEGPEK
jgi:hypothetical protein